VYCGRRPMDTEHQADASPPAESPTEAGWHADPFGRFERRWWDGRRWSEKVADGRAKGLDPPGIDTTPASFEVQEPTPAAPITDATLPIAVPSPWGQITMALGAVVMVSLVVLLALFAGGVLR